MPVHPCLYRSNHLENMSRWPLFFHSEMPTPAGEEAVSWKTSQDRTFLRSSSPFGDKAELDDESYHRQDALLRFRESYTSPS